MDQVSKQLTRQDRFDYHHHLGIVKRAEEHAVAFIHSLSEIKRRKLYTLDYGTWEEFCERECPKSLRQINKDIRDLRLMESIKPEQTQDGSGSTLPVPERGIEQLRRLPASEQTDALAEATRDAGKKAPTHTQIKAAVDRRLGQREDTVPVTDARGSPIKDPQFREVFTDGALFPAVERYVSHLKGMVQQLLESNAGGVLAEQRQDIERDRQNILSALKFSRPYAICPYCGGRRDDCKGCKGRGWVTKEAWNQSPAKAE